MLRSCRWAKATAFRTLFSLRRQPLPVLVTPSAAKRTSARREEMTEAGKENTRPLEVRGKVVWVGQVSMEVLCPVAGPTTRLSQDQDRHL